MPANSQYYYTEKNQPGNSNGLPLYFGGNSNLFLAAIKFGLFT